MSDGNTVTILDPVEGLDTNMRHAFDFFSSAANAIVRASDLGHKLASVEAELSHLREALATVQDGYSSLEARYDRKCEDWANERERANNLQAECYRLAQRADVADRDIDNLRNTLSDRTAERDKWIARANDAEYECVKAQDALASANAKLAKVAEGLGVTLAPATPEPKPNEVAAVALPDPASDHQGHDAGAPYTVPEVANPASDHDEWPYPSTAINE